MKKVSNRLYLARKIFDYTVVLILILLLLFIWQLYRGPIAVPFLKPYIIAALNQDNENAEVTVDSVNIELVRSIKPIKIIAKNVVYEENDGHMRINAPGVAVSFSIRALLQGVIAPSSIEVNNPSVYIFTDYGVRDKTRAAEVSRKQIDYYVTAFEEFLERFNSPDRTYSESYINDIEINNGKVEFHEVDLGRKWEFADLNYNFERNLTDIETEISGSVKLRDKLVSVGMEARYRPSDNRLAAQIYFSDLVPADIVDTYVNGGARRDWYNVNLPINGKIAALINFNEFLKNRGDLIEAVDTALEKIKFQLEGGRGFILFDTGDADSRYDISSFMLEGEINGGLDRVAIENADFYLGEQKVTLGFNVSGLEDYLLEDSKKNLRLSLTADIRKLKFDDLYTYWPRYVAPDAWEWCRDSIFGGDAKNARFEFDFGYDEKTKTFGLTDLKGKAYIADSNLRYINTMPMVNNVYGVFSVTPTSINIALDKAVSDGIMLSEGNVLIYDLDKYNNYIDIRLFSNSSIADALKLIDHKPLEFTSQMGLHPEVIEGEADTELGLKFELKKDLDYDDVNVTVNSKLHNVRIKDAVDGRPITAKELELAVDNDGMSVKGDAEFDGIPLKIVWDERFKTDKPYRSRYQASLKLDAAGAEKFGLDYEMLKPPYFEGSAEVEATATQGGDDKLTVDLKAKLQKAVMNYSFLGFYKPAGAAADFGAKLVFAKKQLTSIPDFKLHKSDFDIAGKISFDKKGAVRVVDIGKIKGPKTQAGAKIEMPSGKNGVVKINISGDSYDLSEFFDRGKNSSAAAGEAENDWEKTPDVDVNIAVNRLWTNPDVSVTGFAGSARLRNGVGVHEVHMIGNYDHNRSMNLKVDYVPRPNGEWLLSVSSNHAGNTLRFLRIYNDMHGGNLQIEAKKGADGEFIGHAKIRDFSLHNTPLLARLLTVASFSGMVDMLTGEGMTFSHFDAPFKYKNRILSVKSGKTYGNVVGLTFSGAYNTANEDISIKGMIAPAYGLNTLIGRIPLVGSLLAGKDGTVFAANYSITGKASDPKVRLNPLSVLSPNSLKDAVSSVFGGEDDRF
jgi:hypothetical protein